MSSLLQLNIQNRFHSLDNHFYKEFKPQGLINPQLIKVDQSVAALLGLNRYDTRSDNFLRVFSGNSLPPGCIPLAHDYAGHQLGKFNPFLGDGRAVLLLDTKNQHEFWECNMKGIGQTPYSRDFDGRASLTECLHEYSTSQKLHELGVPTTRSLCVISGDERVYRQQFEPAAIITRVAPGFIRFGTFENYFFQRNEEALRKLSDYVINHYYPECKDAGDARYACFFRKVVIRTARLIAHWQSTGFVHGMMNTDNQSILGITLDLGESSFTDTFDPDYVSSKNDEKGRYAFGQQPVIGLWNCNILARALSPIIKDTELRMALACYETTYIDHFSTLKNNH